MLKVENLSISYIGADGEATPAVRAVSFSVKRGEVLGLVGESGSGKSTAAMAIPRLLPHPAARIDAGSILFDGVDLLSLPLDSLREIRGKRIGTVFQDPMSALSPLHSVGDQLAESILLHRDMSRAAVRDLSLEWLAKTGIRNPAERIRALPHELSGGEQQRVMIAMALVNEPDLLIADEPTTALDVTVQAQILRLVKSLTGRNSAVIFITHDLGVVSEMATKIAVMKGGEVVESRDDAAEFFADPHHPYSKSLVKLAMCYNLSK